MKRKIAAILAADIAGYSKLVAEDEEETLHRLAIYRAVFDDFVARYGGRIFNTAGDATLAEFQSAVDAIRCAVDVQESLRTRNLAYAPGRQMSFRIGITIGDIVERDGDLLGDGVNIASRLEGVAPAGGICISRAVHEAVTNKVSLKFDDLGPLALKNIPDRVHAYQVALAPQPSSRMPDWLATLSIVGVAILAIAVAGTGAYMFTQGKLPFASTPPTTTASRTAATEQDQPIINRGATVPPAAPSSQTAETKGNDLGIPSIERQSLRVRLGRSSQEGWKPRGLLGVRVVDLGPSLAEVLGVGGPKSAWVVDWFETGPAAAAGIQIGDVLLNLNGRQSKDAQDFIRLVGENSPGSEVTIEIARPGDGAADLVRLVSDRAQAGDAHAVTALGRLREFGVGIPKSESEAKRLYERGAALGSEDAKFYLARLYHRDRDTGEEGIRAIRAAAEANDVEMINALGRRYLDGIGVAKDQAEALRWYRKAAELGSGRAMTFLGLCYANGLGVPRDYSEAVNWFRKSAEGGDPEGAVALGHAYFLGHGVTADDEAAVKWFRRAAENNDVRGMLTLGLMLHRGQGAEKDEEEAVRLVRIALRSGESTLAEYLNALRLTTDDKKWLQAQLKELGVYSAAIDGEFTDNMKQVLQDAGRIAKSTGKPDPSGAAGKSAEADVALDAVETCRRYLPSIGKTVEVDCEDGMQAETPAGMPDTAQPQQAELAHPFKDMWGNSLAACKRDYNGWRKSDRLIIFGAGTLQYITLGGQDRTCQSAQIENKLGTFSLRAHCLASPAFVVSGKQYRDAVEASDITLAGDGQKLVGTGPDGQSLELTKCN
jgi:TPR repeat protein/class 3 adenylate cyclase